MKRRHIAITILYLAVSLVPRLSAGQAEVTSPGFYPKGIVSGQVGMYGELYEIDGRENRRPFTSGRMFMRPTIALSKDVTITFDFLVSNEGRSSRQDINQVGIWSNWRWGGAKLGDFYQNYSPFVLQGIRLRGGEFRVRRGMFEVSTLGGRGNRAVTGGAENGTFERNLAGGRATVRRDDTRFRGELNAVAFYAADDPSSLAAPPDSLPLPDSTQVGNVANPFAVTPQENLVIAAIGKVSFPQQGIELKSELARSDFTRDRRASDTVGENKDTAFKAGLAFQKRRFQIEGRYKYVGPAYVSLGVYSLHNDQQEVYVGSRLNFGTGTAVILNGSRQNDNLDHQKQNTTNRYRLNGIVTFRPANVWVSTLTTSYLTMDNSSKSDSTRVDFASVILSTTQSLNFPATWFMRNISGAYTLQTAGDNNPLREGSDSQAHSASLRSLLGVTTAFTLTPSYSVVSSRAGLDERLTTHTYGMTVLQRALKNRLTTSLYISGGFADDSDSYLTRLSSRLQVKKQLHLQLLVSARTFKGTGPGGTDYDEYRSSLKWTYQF